MIGPSFGNEVIAAGLAHLPIVWDESGITSDLSLLTQQERNAIDVVIANHDPTKALVPPAISDRQFAHALKNAGVITFAEALAFVQTGTIPAALAQFIADIPAESQREDAELLLSGATMFERAHPMTEVLRAGLGWTAAETDDLWRQAASL